MSAAYSREAASAETTLSEDVLDAAIKKGHLRAKQVGRRVIILPSDLEAFLESLPDVEVKAS